MRNLLKKIHKTVKIFTRADFVSLFFKRFPKLRYDTQIRYRYDTVQYFWKFKSALVVKALLAPGFHLFPWHGPPVHRQAPSAWTSSANTQTLYR
jgi:hypothetical protein